MLYQKLVSKLHKMHLIDHQLQPKGQSVVYQLSNFTLWLITSLQS